jgi:hypothetical protein
VVLDGGGVQLGNDGGNLVLLDDHGNQVDSVTYSKQDAAQVDRFVRFTELPRVGSGACLTFIRTCAAQRGSAPARW